MPCNCIHHRKYPKAPGALFCDNTMAQRCPGQARPAFSLLRDRSGTRARIRCSARNAEAYRSMCWHPSGSHRVRALSLWADRCACRRHCRSKSNTNAEGGVAGRLMSRSTGRWRPLGPLFFDQRRGSGETGRPAESESSDRPSPPKESQQT